MTSVQFVICSMLLCVACSSTSRGSEIVLGAPRDAGFAQSFPLPAAALTALIPEAADSASFSCSAIDTRTFELSLGMGLNQSGQWARVVVEDNGRATLVRYYSERKDSADEFENTPSAAVRFMSTLSALVAAKWSATAEAQR